MAKYANYKIIKTKLRVLQYSEFWEPTFRSLRNSFLKLILIGLLVKDMNLLLTTLIFMSLSLIENRRDSNDYSHQHS